MCTRTSPESGWQQNWTLRSDYCSDYKRQKTEFQNSIATNVATTPFIDRFELPKQREGIYKEKKIEISLLSCPAFWRGVRLSPPRGKSASIAFWYQKAACRENPDPNMPPAGGERSAVRKNQYNLHIRLDEDERAALEKGLQASSLPLSAYLRKLILGESIQAAPSEELRRLRTEIHQIGNNINQLARKANAGFASRDEVTRALRMLDRVYELMYEFSK